MNLAYVQRAYTKFIRLSSIVHANSNSDSMDLLGQINNIKGGTRTYGVLQPTGITMMRKVIRKINICMYI